MVVVGDETFRSGLVGNLRDDGHSVIEHHSAVTVPRPEALGAIDAVLIDYQHPGDDWLRLARRFHRIRPRVPVILATAQWSPVVERIARCIGPVVRKPIAYDDLHELLHCLARHAKPQPRARTNLPV